MNFLFYLTAVLFSLGQLGRISFFGQQINFYLYEITLIISLIFLLIKYQFKPLIEGWKNYKTVYSFLMILVLSILFDFSKYSPFQNFVGSLYILRLVLYFLYFFFLHYHVKFHKNFSQIIKKGVYIIAVLTIVLTFTQYFLYPDLRNLIYQGWDPHLFRTFGVFFDTSISAAIFGILFLSINQPIIKIIYLVLIALSFSRSIYIGLLLTLLYIFIQEKKLKKMFIFLLIFLGLLILIPKPGGEGVNLQRLYSISSRAVDYQIGIKLWQNKPLLGYGYDRIRYIKKSDSIHSGAAFSSSFLTMLVSSGVLGLISFVLMLWNLRKSNKIALILLVFLSIISLFDNILLHPFILFLLLINLSDK